MQFIKAILGKVWHLHSKNKMFGLHNWVIPFFLIYLCMLCHFILKRKIFKEHVKQKKKKIIILSNIVASVFLGDVRVI